MQLTMFERFLEIFGIAHLRCRDCDERFSSGLFSLRDSPYAKCPRCHGMKLTRWRREKYRIGTLTKLVLLIGGKPLRCAPCRCNFVSFRKLKPAANKPEAEALGSAT